MMRSFPYWLITRRAGRRSRALTTRVSGREVLPVFGFEEEAQMFIYLAALGSAWRTRRTSAGEIVSLLYGPCSSVSGIILDPIPGVAPDAAHRTSFGRREFVDFLFGQQKKKFSAEQKVRSRGWPTPVDRARRGSVEAV